MGVMFLYDRYVKLFGIRRLGEMENPRVRPIARFGLPRGTNFHYQPMNETELGPSGTSPVIAAAQRLVYIDHVPDLLAKEGNPRPTFKLLAPMMQQYRRENMQIRPMKDYDQAAKEPLNMIVVNYAMVSQMFKYQRSALSRWWAWRNLRGTQWERFNRMKTTHERHHIVVFDCPNSLPALSDLRKAERAMTPALMQVFNTRERLDLLDLFIWLGENRKSTPMGVLDESRLHEIDLIIRRETGFISINLGLLNSFRKAGAGVSMESFADQPVSEDFDFEETYQRYVSMEMAGDDTLDEDMQVSMEAAPGLDPKIIQLRFLKLLTKIIDQTNPIVTAPAEQQVEAMTEAKAEEEAAQAEEEQAQEEQLLAETGADELLVNEEEELAAALDEPAQPANDSELTDEDGNLIIETGNQNKEAEIQVVGTSNITHTLTSTIQSKIEDLVDKELITAAQYRRMQRLAESYKTMENPWDKSKTVEQSLEIPFEDLALQESENYPQMDAIRDQSMRQSTVEKMDSQYIEKVMKGDILNAVMSVQKAGIAVTGYEIETVKDAVSNYEIHRIQLTPVTGKPSTISFRVPIVDKRGVYISNGQRYRMRTQKADVPIRKVSPIRVALTSYYSKMFVERSQRATFNYDAWVGKQIIAKGLDPADTSITNVKVADVADYELDVPTAYTVIGSRVMSFEANGHYWFDYKNRERSRLFDMKLVEKIEAEHKGMIVCGRRDQRYITVDKDNAFYLLDEKTGQVTELGQIEDVLALQRDKSPVGMAEISIFGKIMPIGIALSYLLGLDRLLEMTKAKYRVVPLGTRLQMSDDEYAIKFLDETLVLEKSDVQSSLIFAGFLHYHKHIRSFSRHSFNAKDVYFNILEANGIGLRYMRELDLMNAMWVDPITKGILEWMKEPTEFVPLLIRAVELLVTRYVPQNVEGADGLVEGQERAKGYERIPGAIYGELVRSIRVYNSRSASNTSSVSMKPHEVWTNIVQDPASALVDDINPIQNLKQKEIITYGGRGGRSSRSMTAESRLYKESDIGFISESTVDSGDVAVITYMSPNANITSVRGTIRKYDKEKDGAANIVSTSALISPFADRDDPKRVNFIGIQQSHVISSEGYRESPISTGYDHVLAHRVDEIFAVPASKNGEVVERTDEHIVVAYEDGTFEHLDLSTQYGISAGAVYPQYQASTFQLGDKVQKGDILKYNSGFFKPSRFHPRQVQWKAGVIARTALMEASYTLEDSSAIDDWLAKQLGSEVTKVKTIVVRFDQTIRNLVKEGEHTDITSILCTIEDAVTADSGLFSDDDLDILRKMGSATPQAGAVGEVSKIEVFYHGDPDDMSDSLLELVTAHDKQRRKAAKRLGMVPFTGQVDQSLRIDGNGLELDHVAIKVYITHREGMGVGDKAVFCNQMKTVVGHRLDGVNETADGTKINAIFGAKSVMDRIVSSALLIGMTISTLTAIGEKAADMWTNVSEQ
ncbi:putative virion-associated RNA polymerase subunit beta/beta' [Pseudomonas phage pPa_SNUABM_DT01]|nr:putative virion-associated RNA polymerase subunit beta/beta' [Pseudomonas phage pPa_SNUABM_DT01]